MSSSSTLTVWKGLWPKYGPASRPGRWRQVETGGWRLVGPLAPVTPTSIGRFRTERKALEQQVIHALVRLLGWQLKGDDHFRALQRIQRRLNAFKSDLPAAEDLLLEQLALEGCGLQKAMIRKTF